MNQDMIDRLVLVVIYFLLAVEMVSAPRRKEGIKTKKWTSRGLARTEIAPAATTDVERADIAKMLSNVTRRMEIMASTIADVKRMDIASPVTTENQIKKPARSKKRRLKLGRTNIVQEGPSLAQRRRKKISKIATAKMKRIKTTRPKAAKTRKIKARPVTAKMRRVKMTKPWFVKRKKTKISRPLPAERTTKKMSRPTAAEMRRTTTMTSALNKTIGMETAGNVPIIQESKCGIDFSYSKEIHEGEADIETYPWFGLLVFPLKGVITTSPVVLITKQLVIGSAMEIGALPKTDFRARSKVIIGHNCSGPKIKVKDYAYHPDFQRSTFSSLVLIQLDVFVLEQELRPICPPPIKVYHPDFYAVTLAEDCTFSTINIHKMKFVDTNECQHFYRRSGLDIGSIWPRHTVCAKALKGGSCIWRNGVFLVAKHDDRWNLIGFGVQGPGCESPARFLDYGMYHQWVKGSIARIGSPTVTRIADNQIIMRRRMATIQRFGPCDAEEKYVEIYTDHTAIVHEDVYINFKRVAHYNFTILAMYEYSCIIFTANQDIPALPKIRLKRFCLASRVACHQFSTLQIDFHVTIEYSGSVHYHVNVFGQELRVLDTKRMNVYFNLNEMYPNITVGFNPR